LKISCGLRAIAVSSFVVVDGRQRGPLPDRGPGVLDLKSAARGFTMDDTGIALLLEAV
jgi:hypothetical protein